MSKIKFDKEGTKNLLKMLQSSDVENQTTALMAINNADLKKYVGELLVLYKFGKSDHTLWKEDAPKAFKVLKKLIGDSKLTSGFCLSIMTENAVSNTSIELYFESLVETMKLFMEQVGYPVELFDITFKLKEK
jgi:hypothetical protein